MKQFIMEFIRNKMTPLPSLTPLIILIPLLGETVFTQPGDYVYFKNFVRHADGGSCTHVPPSATFTAYLNNDPSIILIEKSPRWEAGADPNIPGSGVFGVELGNFADPPLTTGDSIFIRYTCNATTQQAILKAQVSEIPWYYFPVTLHLSPVDLPDTPENVEVNINGQHQRIITWDAQPGLTYSIYRSSLQDTIFNGNWRHLYYLMADDLTGGQFTDTTTTDTSIFSYIIYAKNEQSIFSSHSREAIESDKISGLAITPGVTTATLTWATYHPPLGELKGYNIYRRKEGESFGPPIAYTDAETRYVDSRLLPGSQYFYKIIARTDASTEIGESDEIAVQTQVSQAGLYTYANLKVAVVIYQHTNRGEIFDDDIPRIKSMLEEARLFYWRNSNFRLNLEFTYYIISAYRGFGDPNETHVQLTIDDLIQMGVMNTQYDVIFRICPAVYGYWSFGVINLALPGPGRKSGFSHSYWPINTAVRYPGSRSDLDYGLTWIFVHEVQHAIDALYDANGHPEMYHGDRPWEFPVACGEHFDFQAKMFRTFTAYEDLLPNWGDIYEAVDADEDGFPDNDPTVPLDELRFGSSPLKVDTDDDGYNDKQEACDGNYSGSNPLNPDTDGDGLLDGQDPYVRYAMQTTIPRFKPQVDGFIEGGWPLIDQEVIYTQVGYSPRFYMSLEDDSLYLALYLENYGVATLSFDFQADGWWQGSGNTVMTINSQVGNFSEFHTWDASEEVKNFSLAQGGPGGMWDDDPVYQQQFHRRVIDPSAVNLKVVREFPMIQIEMAIPRAPFAGLNLNPGDRIGVNVTYQQVNNEPDQWATTFDLYSFAYVTLGSSTGLPHTHRLPETISELRLLQNYPNPFNPQTTIEFQLPYQTDLELVVFNVLGQKIRTLASGNFKPGNYKMFWNGRNDSGQVVPGGIYFYRLTTSNQHILVKKMLLMR